MRDGKVSPLIPPGSYVQHVRLKNLSGLTIRHHTTIFDPQEIISLIPHLPPASNRSALPPPSSARAALPIHTQ